MTISSIQGPFTVLLASKSMVSSTHMIKGHKQLWLNLSQNKNKHPPQLFIVSSITYVTNMSCEGRLTSKILKITKNLFQCVYIFLLNPKEGRVWHLHCQVSKDKIIFCRLLLPMVLWSWKFCSKPIWFFPAAKIQYMC
jgi:hypothetical protein